MSLPVQVLGDYLASAEKGSSVAVFSIHHRRPLWRSPVLQTALNHQLTENIEGILLTEDNAFVTRFDQKLTTYSLSSGMVLWEATLPGRTFPYLATDGVNVFVAAGTTLRAYEGPTGVTLWERTDLGYAGPLLHEAGTLFIIDEGRSALSALEATTNTFLWTTDLEAVSDFEIECLATSEDLVFVASEEIVAVSKNNGAVQWVSDQLGRAGCPVVLGQVVYVSSARNAVFALNASTGEPEGMIRSGFSTTASQHHPIRGPLVTDSLVVIPIDEYHLVAYGPSR